VNFGNAAEINRILPILGVPVALNAITTFSVNLFYIHRIYKLSKRSWLVTGPMIILAFVRVSLGIATTSRFIVAREFTALTKSFDILFTISLSTSAFTDVVVSAARYYYLRDLRDGYNVSKEMVDVIVVFTVNDGALTCIVAIACIVLRLSMPHNFVFIAVFFSTSKLYSNSLLATLNLRNWYRHRYDLPRRPRGIIMARTSAIKPTIQTSREESTQRTTRLTNLDMPVAKSVELEDEGNHLEVVIDREVEYKSEFVLRGLDRGATHDSTLSQSQNHAS